MRAVRAFLYAVITFDAEARRWFDRLPQLILKSWPDSC